MWFEYNGLFLVEESDFEEMIADIKSGTSINGAFDYWRIGLDDCEYYIAPYVEDKIKNELRRRLDA